MSFTVAFGTLGCKQNQFDTQSLRAQVLSSDFSPASRSDRADWYILNTCAVTERAMAKARGEINRLRRRNKKVMIVVLGCGVTYQPDNFAQADFVGVIPPEFGLKSLLSSVADLRLPHGLIPAGRSRALLRVQTGCDQFCAFCVVPRLRGSPRSVPLEECLQALRDVLDQGVVEIVLTGTNIALWGRDLPGAPTLVDLLKALVASLGEARLRLSSLEPQLISPRFFQWCLDQAQICRHFHLAIQSDSRSVLNRMEREAPPPGFYQSLADLAHQHPDVSWGADVIAGLPGENQAEFEETLKIIESIPLSYLHVFPYSERRGTRAAERSDRIPIPEKLHRAKILRQIDADLRKRFRQINAGRHQDIVMIGNNGSGRRSGLTSNYLRVAFAPGFAPPGPRFSHPVGTSESAVYILPR